MLSNEEKREMLEDAKSKERRQDFRFAKNKEYPFFSLDEYLLFLNDIQKIFGAFKVSNCPTITKLNKL